jgi:hypothetical protein
MSNLKTQALTQSNSRLILIEQQLQTAFGLSCAEWQPLKRLERSPAFVHVAASS